MATVSVNLDVDAQAINGILRNLQNAVANINDLNTFVNSAVNNAAGQTYTPAQFDGGLIVRSGAAAVTDTTPTAAQIVGAIRNCAIGDTFLLLIQNNNSGTLTIGAGTNVTLVGTTTIATALTRLYAVTVTAVATPAVTLRGIMTAAV